MAKRPSLSFKHGRGVGGVTARAVTSRGQDADGRWYWRMDEYLGHGKRATVWTGWAQPDDADRRAAGLYADREAAQAAREERRRQEQVRVKEKGRTVKHLVERWMAAVEVEARETRDSEVAVNTADGGTVRLRPRLGSQARDGRRASRAIRSVATLNELRVSAKRIVRLVGKHPVGDPDGAMAALEAGVLAEAEDRGRRPSLLVLDGLVARLHRAYRWGQANGLVSSVPRISGYSVDRRDPSSYALEKWTPTVAGMELLLRALADVASSRQGWARPLVLLLATTGMRIGEVASLRVGDLDLERGFLRLRLRKGGDSAGIALLPLACNELGTWTSGKAPGDLLFPRVLRRGPPKPPAEERLARGKALSGRVNRLLRQAAEKVGIEHRVTAHSIRRCVCNAVVEKAASNIYSDLIGHSHSVADDSYLNRNADRQRQALADALGDLGANRSDSTAETGRGASNVATVTPINEARKRRNTGN